MSYVSSDSLLGLVDFYAADTIGVGPSNLVGGASTMGRESFYCLKVKGVDSNLGSAGEFVYAKNTTANVAGQTISSITTAAGTSVATLTTGAAHGLQPGAIIVLTGQVPSSYSGTWTVLSTPSTTTLTFNHGNANLAASTTQGTYTYGAVFPSLVVSFSSALTNGQIITSAVAAASTANTGKSIGFAMGGLLFNQWGWFQTSGIAIAQTAGAPAVDGLLYLGAAGALTSVAANGKQLINSSFASAVSATIGTGSTAVTLTATQALVMVTNPAVQTQIV